MALSYHSPRKLRELAFASATLYWLTSPHTCTPWLVIQNVRYTPLSAYQSITIRFQVLLTLCQEFFSAFPHGTIFAIGLDLYLGLEVDAPRILASFPRHDTQEQIQILKVLPLRGSHPLKHCFPTNFEFPFRIVRIVLQHHISITLL